MRREPVADLRTPVAWAQQYSVSAAVVAAADALHGWTLHAHHEGEAFKLSEIAFLDAVAAVDSHPTLPADEACSPHRNRRL